LVSENRKIIIQRTTFQTNDGISSERNSFNNDIEVYNSTFGYSHFDINVRGKVLVDGCNFESPNGQGFSFQQLPNDVYIVKNSKFGNTKMKGVVYTRDSSITFINSRFENFKYYQSYYSIITNSFNKSEINIINCEFSNNSGKIISIVLRGKGSFKIDKSIFQYNIALPGESLFECQNSDATFNVTNTLFRNNRIDRQSSCYHIPDDQIIKKK